MHTSAGFKRRTNNTAPQTIVWSATILYRLSTPIALWLRATAYLSYQHHVAGLATGTVQVQEQNHVQTGQVTEYKLRSCREVKKVLVSGVC